MLTSNGFLVIDQHLEFVYICKTKLFTAKMLIEYFNKAAKLVIAELVKIKKKQACVR
jgi:hypothetical protein